MPRTMSKYLSVAVLALLRASGTYAQSAVLKLPDFSQHARVLQRLGLTDITIDYSRPALRGRKMFGGALAYGEVWRAGANFNTTFEVTDPVTIEGQPLPRGVYGLHMIPGETSWTVIFSRNSTSWGSFSYDPAEDALRVTVKPRAIEPQEMLSYELVDVTPRSTVVTMRWERVEVPFRVEVDTPVLVAQSLRNQLRGRAQSEWQAWAEVANFLLENKVNTEEALQDAEQSVAIEDRFENEITKARALSALGRGEEAQAVRNKALGMGTERQVYDFGRGLQRVNQQEQALEVFRINITKHPGTVLAHNAAARVAAAKGDYDTAVKEMKLAVSMAPERSKPGLADLLRQLENGVDINK